MHFYKFPILSIDKFCRKDNDRASLNDYWTWVVKKQKSEYSYVSDNEKLKHMLDDLEERFRPALYPCEDKERMIITGLNSKNEKIGKNKDKDNGDDNDNDQFSEEEYSIESVHPHLKEKSSPKKKVRFR